MSKYELVFILDARLSDGEKNDIAKQVADLVAKCSGKVVDSSLWLEKQRMPFPLKKVWEGAYYLLHMEMAGADVARFRRDLQINERVLRFLLVAQEEVKVAA